MNYCGVKASSRRGSEKLDMWCFAQWIECLFNLMISIYKNLLGLDLRFQEGRFRIPRLLECGKRIVISHVSLGNVASSIWPHLSYCYELGKIISTFTQKDEWYGNMRYNQMTNVYIKKGGYKAYMDNILCHIPLVNLLCHILWVIYKYISAQSLKYEGLKRAK